eukprot:XP_020393696.1 uncharacterized protein LOC109939784 [Zea mays]
MDALAPRSRARPPPPSPTGITTPPPSPSPWQSRIGACPSPVEVSSVGLFPTAAPLPHPPETASFPPSPPRHGIGLPTRDRFLQPHLDHLHSLGSSCTGPGEGSTRPRRHTSALSLHASSRGDGVDLEHFLAPDLGEAKDEDSCAKFYAGAGPAREVWASVEEFGAVGDGATPNTAAFRRAVVQLGARATGGGGARLDVPPGRWLTGSFNLTSRFTLFGPVRSRLPVLPP